jgi:hypothetical protein
VLHALEVKGIVDQSPNIEECMCVIDGMVYFQALTNIPETFGELVDFFLSRFPKCSRIHFVTDTYLDVPIKNIEKPKKWLETRFL